MNFDKSLATVTKVQGPSDFPKIKGKASFYAYNN